MNIVGHECLILNRTYNINQHVSIKIVQPEEQKRVGVQNKCQIIFLQRWPVNLSNVNMYST